MNNDRDTYAELRGQIDSNDPFMTGGHQILKERQSHRDVPDWTLNDKSVQAILLRSFPKLAINPVQRMRAARWARIIYMSFREKRTSGQIAEEMKIKKRNLERLIQSILRAGRGLKANTGKALAGKKGRPKKTIK